MTTQTQPRTREPRPLRGASRKSSTAEPHAARFDAQRCYERYIASHHDPDSAGIFPGVPFNRAAPVSSSKGSGKTHATARRSEMRELRCRDVGFDCQHVMQGANDDEVLAQAREHARDEHEIEQMDPETEQKVRSLIHDS